MGVSIHYRGQLDDLDLFTALRDEMKDMALTMDWSFTELDDDWAQPPDASLIGNSIEGHLGLRGILVSPHPESESLALFFDRDGHLRSPMTMLSIIEGTLEPDKAWVSMKTQFSGPDTHVWVIGLLKYLKKRYISNLEVSDESQYWETGNREELEKSMDLINRKLDDLSSKLSSERMGDVSNLSADEIAERIEQLLRKAKEENNK